jgi:hypothetical protein
MTTVRASKYSNPKRAQSTVKTAVWKELATLREVASSIRDVSSKKRVKPGKASGTSRKK